MSKYKFRCEILKNNIAVGNLNFLRCQIDCDKDAAIHRTASFVVRDTLGVDLLKDKLRPIMSVYDEQTAAYKDFSLGVFLPLSPTSKMGDGLPQEQIDAYDLCAVIREDRLTERLYIAAGTKYTDAITELIIGSGVENTEIIPSEKVLVADREFEIGASKLDVANELLSEINYRSVEADANGVIVVKPYAQPTMARAKHIYRADGKSKLKLAVTKTADYYNVPNVFVAVVSNADLETDLVSVYTNDNPKSKLSTISRERKIVSEIYRPDGIASQEDLDNYIVRKAFEVSQVEQTVEVRTALNPLHGIGDVVFIEHPEATGAFEEASWSMTLSASGEMTHILRRVAGD